MVRMSGVCAPVSESSAPAPWYVVAADHKWFTRLASAAIVMQILRTINREYPRRPPSGWRGHGPGSWLSLPHRAPPDRAW